MSIVYHFDEVFAYVIGLQKTQFKDQAIEPVKSTLDRLFEQAKKTVLAEYSEELYNESLFAICAWIDEVVLCSPWKLKNQWRTQMLQQQLFDTTRAGELFFDKLDRVSAGETQVLEVYYYCLKLGFRGKYHQVKDNVIISEKCKSYYKVIINQYGGDLDRPLINCTLTPQAYIEQVSSPGASKQGKGFWSKLIWWVMPIIPFGIITIVFNEVIQAMAADYFKSLS